MNNKTLTQRLIFVFKKAYNTPTLPKYIIDFTMRPEIIIFRVIGGISNLLLISSPKYITLPYPHISVYILLVIVSCYLIYHLYLGYYRFKHIRFLIKSGQMDIYNPPLLVDKFCSIAMKLLLCLKNYCVKFIRLNSWYSFKLSKFTGGAGGHKLNQINHFGFSNGKVDNYKYCFLYLLF